MPLYLELANRLLTYNLLFGGLNFEYLTLFNLDVDFDLKQFSKGNHLNKVDNKSYSKQNESLYWSPI